MADHPDLQVAVLARNSLAACRAELLAARESMLTSREAEGVHGTRVALRRIRAAAAFFGRTLQHERLLALRGEAGRLARSCAGTRDLDVFLAGTLKEAESNFAGDEEARTAICAFRAAALLRRNDQHDAACLALSGILFDAFDDRLQELIAVPLDGTSLATGDSTSSASALLGRRNQQLQTGLERFDELDGAERHQLRLRVKKQRYAAMLVAPLFRSKAASTYVKAVADLQDAMGRANDRLTAINVIADIRVFAHPCGQLDWSAGLLTGWLKARTRANEDRAVRRAIRGFGKADPFWRIRDRGSESRQ
jgi:CHAD domain-containing protein